jgi:hypothetical protein
MASTTSANFGRKRALGPVAVAFVFLFFIAISALLSGCTHPQIKNVMVGYNNIRAVVISNLPNGLKDESMNGRTFTSGYFSPKDFDTDGTELPERAIARIVILGEGRPYNLEVTVYREHRAEGSTHYVREKNPDRKLSNMLVEKVQSALADRREDRNFIDDFRTF